jgi:homoserine kinase
MFLSGAGSTILIVSKKEIKADLQKIVSVLENEWQVKPIKVDYDGLKITDK